MVVRVFQMEPRTYVIVRADLLEQIVSEFQTNLSNSS